MKLKSLLFIASASACFAAFATNFTWTGGGNDGGLWNNPANWGQSSNYPQTASDVVIFAGDANVSLNTGGETTISYIKVNAGTATITATAGSSLKLDKPGHGTNGGTVNTSGFTIAKGATLNLAVSFAEISARFDKWGEGTLILHDANIVKTDGGAWYLSNGTNVFDGTTSISLPNATICFGNGSPYSYMPSFIRDHATFSVKGIGTSGSTPAPAADIIQEGADTLVNVGASGIDLNSRRATELERYTLKSGTLTSAGPIVLRSPDDTSAIQYVQEGGTSTFATVTMTSGSAALRGGVMNFTGANDKFTMGGGTTFEISGGTLGWPRGFNPSGWTQFRYSGRFGVTVPSGSNFDWDWSRAHVAPGTVFVHDGAGTLKFIRAISTEGVGLELGAGKTVTIDSGCTVSAPRYSVEPWKVTLNEGSILQLQDSRARLHTPLDLTVNGTGKINFNGHRCAVVAHKLMVDGVEKTKGRYYTSGNSFVDGLAQCSIIVPHVWTGEGGDNLWSTAANWDSNTVPNGNTACVDISRATTIELNSAVTVGGIVAMPNGAERKVTVTGSGSITLYNGNGYETSMIIPEACELVLDVNLIRGVDKCRYGISGGGKLTVKKQLPGCDGDLSPYLAMDGTLAIAGTSASIANSGYAGLGIWAYESGHIGRILFEEGTTFSAIRMWSGINSYVQPDEFRQTGGNITFSTFFVNCGNNIGGPPCYYLDGGSLTVNGALNLNIGLASKESDEAKSNRKRYPGGSFEMSGGTLTCEGMTSCGNQNYFRLYGGEVNLKGSMALNFHYPLAIAATNRNDYSYYLGGTTIRPTGAERTLSSGNVWLTGKNGDCTIDVSSYNFNFASGNTVAGPGGLTVVGASSRQVRVSCALNFTGPITVKSGEIICYAASTINGPCAVIVESADGKATFGHGIVNELDRIVLVQDSNLFVSAGQSVTTKRLIVNGVDLPADTYNARFGAGTVIVTGSAPASWLNGTVGDLSWNAASTTTTVDSATTLSSLTYNPAGTAATNTLAGAGVLTFSDGANIYVAKGDTLVIENDVVLGGKVSKTGEGEVVFNGGVTCSGAPAVDNDTCWLTVREGGATFDGAVTGVRLVTCGTKTLPVITLNEHCTVTDFAVVLTAYSYGNAEANVMGETHQNGATVDYSAGVFEALRTSTIASDKDMYPLSCPNGGSGRYVLNSGTFKSSGSYKLTFFEDANVLGTFDFVQNGGTAQFMNQITFARTLNPRVHLAYTLNDGQVEFRTVAGTQRSLDFINFNGGTVVFSGATGSSFAERQFFTVTVGGDVIFQMANAANSVRFPNDWTGDGTATFNGGYFYFSGELNVGGLNITNATVTLGANTALAATGETVLSMARTGATLNLDYDGQMPFKTLTIGGRGRGAGVYSATQGPSAVKRVLAGDGELLILEGTEPGTVIFIR